MIKTAKSLTRMSLALSLAAALAFATTAFTPALAPALAASKKSPPMDKIEVDDGAGSTKILFIGQSITYVNDFPQIFSEIVKAKRPQQKFFVEMIAGGGYSLIDHWQDGTAARALQKQHWDYVVIAESTMNLVVGQQDFEKYAYYLDGEARKAGAKPMTFECYDESHTDDAQSKMHVEAVKEATALHEQLIPVGATYRYVTKYYPLAQIFGPDFHHPSPLGAYLMACVCYSTIFGDSAEGANVAIQNQNLITRKTESLQANSSKSMINICRASYEMAKLYRR